MRRSFPPPVMLPAGPPVARHRRRSLILSLAVVPLLALAAGCGSSGSSAGSSSAAPAASASPATGAAGQVAYPVTVTADNGKVTVPAAPTAIISLAPSLTEMLYAIGAGGQVKAVDDESDFPANAPRTKLSGFQPNAEAIAAYAPDLVVVSSDGGGLIAALGKLKVPVLLLGAPATLDGSYAQELTLGRATGHLGQAEQVVATTKQRIAAAVASVPKSATAVKVYHELDPTYYSVTSSTFIGDLYKQFGLVNIADAAPKVAGGYPQLSAEFVISAAPNLIVLADGLCCQQSVAAVDKRPAFSTIPAVKEGKVVVINDDIASRWGPRVADFADQIAHALSATD